ncbi:hypothetical protein PVAP13_5NG177581 [Panicum virgatum]|uniref:Uncharacterized protein n=1 Tax=Panicum virgatum TaxID=38727 RepID=A0A8T0RNH5_PANVG|nr:hypothetical protein PVAP13_5NG177581 [Panicum virgatum]
MGEVARGGWGAGRRPRWEGCRGEKRRTSVENNPRLPGKRAQDRDGQNRDSRCICDFQLSGVPRSEINRSVWVDFSSIFTENLLISKNKHGLCWIHFSALVNGKLTGMVDCYNGENFRC